MDSTYPYHKRHAKIDTKVEKYYADLEKEKEQKKKITAESVREYLKQQLPK